MIKTLKDFVEQFRETYFEEIEPLIEKGEYEAARGSLFNIVLAMKFDKNIFNWNEIPKIHCGLNLLTSIQLLYENLERPDFDKKRDTERLKAYLAQTKLPIK